MIKYLHASRLNCRSPSGPHKEVVFALLIFFDVVYLTLLLRVREICFHFLIS
jgi:hypothetical protein